VGKPPKQSTKYLASSSEDTDKLYGLQLPLWDMNVVRAVNREDPWMLWWCRLLHCVRNFRQSLLGESFCWLQWELNKDTSTANQMQPGN